MEIERSKGKRLQLYRELIEYVRKTPPLNDMYEMNLARQREKVKKNEKS